MLAVAKMPSFLASACSFQQPTTATSATTNLKCSPQEELADELDQYFRFDAAPVEQKVQGEYHWNDKLSAEEFLLNPLLWWKVHIPLTIYKFLQFD